MPLIPDQMRPYLATLAKYHFWILTAIVPVVLLPLLLKGTGAIDAQIASRKQEIDGRVSALSGVRGISPHPNERWTTAVDAQTQKIREETLAEWKQFWQDQAPLREWPKRLGDDFIRAISGLKPGGALNRAMLLRYQNLVPELVHTLPARMGADDLMAEGATSMGPGPTASPGPRGPLAGIGGPEFGPRGGMGGDFRPRAGIGGQPGAPPGGSRALVQWSAEDQRRLLDSFTFDTKEKRCGKDVISTAQVLLAQEELWVYGVLCDAIRKLNSGADGPFTAPIGTVLELAVGYPAAEDSVGGQNSSRILLPSASNDQLGGAPPGDLMPPADTGAGMGMPSGSGGLAARPPHPRFAGGSASRLGPGGMLGDIGGDGMSDPAATAASPETQLREWIYVDFTGKPLTAAELSSAPAAQLVHLMPFTLRVAMDQRKLDSLLIELATNAVPIDVRQVRVNPSQQAGGASAAVQVDIRAVRRQVGLVFQMPEAQLFEQYVGDDVAYGPRKQGLSRAEVRMRVQRAMEAVGLPFAEFKDRITFGLSGGQMRRVAIAGVLALEPRILVLDEPTAGLDPQARGQLMCRLLDLRGQGITLVMISHNMEELAEICDRLYVIADGRTVMEGTPATIFSRASELRAMRLDVPDVTKVAETLKARGLLPADEVIYTLAQAEDAVAHLLAQCADGEGLGAA